MSAFFNNTTQRAMDGNIKDTPPIIARAARRGSAALGRAGQGDRRDAKPRSRRARRRPARDFDKWLAEREARRDSPPRIPTDGLALARAARRRARARRSTCTLDGQGRDRARSNDGFAWEAGPRRRQGVQSASPAARCEIADAGDFDTKQAFSFGAWVKFPPARPTGAIVARMDDAERLPRLGPVGARTASSARTSSTSGRTTPSRSSPRTPLQPNAVDHVFVTYDGSAKAAGVKIYVNGEPQADRRRQPTRSRARITTTTVPFKLGQRHTASALDRPCCIAGRAHLRPRA